LGAVEKTVSALQERQSALATQTTSDLGQTFARLSGKLAGSEPFAAELDALANEAPAVPGIDVLRPLAATGVSSPGDLAAQLDKIAAELNKAPSSEGEAAPSDGGLMGALASKLGTVVKIRKIDEADWPSVLTNAAAQVRNGQLIAALSLVTGQPGAAPEGLAAWLKSAENRVKADKALQQLSQAVLSRLAASSRNG
ncbi:MAG: COG4223 family protein, partial [Aestuariivirgaceae bacterium]